MGHGELCLPKADFIVSMMSVSIHRELGQLTWRRDHLQRQNYMESFKLDQIISYQALQPMKQMHGKSHQTNFFLTYICYILLTESESAYSVFAACKPSDIHPPKASNDFFFSPMGAVIAIPQCCHRGQSYHFQLKQILNSERR